MSTGGIDFGFITVDGPDGVGKTTFISKLRDKLQCRFSVYSTKEPTDDAFGIYVKEKKHCICGLAYAYLISANRAYHYETSLKEALSAYDIVICDRYIGSSLALQPYDGVEIDVVWELNSFFIVPDLSIFMLACESEIEQRLSYRKKLSYFERKMTRAEEIYYYESAYDFMNKKGMTTLLLDNSAAYYDDNIRIVEKKIMEMRGIT